jgi:L-ascorbate metabolism protein UlaG (beta-lactamase superfamily)
MELTWYGHSAFKIKAGGASILIDPFLTGNPSWNKGWQEVAEGVTHVLLTHGHNDHVGDAAEIAKATGSILVANPELCGFMAAKGVTNVNPGNHGGTLDCNGFTVTFVNALHSSAFTLENGENVYLGNPAGLVLHFENEPTLYHMGDTDIFGDMALINELHQPEIGLVPIGDRFTMGGAVAALACRRFFNFRTVVPCHYATFGLLDQSAETFDAGMADSDVAVLIPTIGEPVQI